MKTLALDLAKRWGWCVARDRHGWYETAWPRRGRNYYEFFDWLKRKIEFERVDRIAIETVVTGGYKQQDAMLVLAGMYAMTEMVAACTGVDLVEVSPMTIKKFITGSGKSKKPEVVTAVRGRVGFRDVQDHNEADACALWLYADQMGDKLLPADEARAARREAKKQKRRRENSTKSESSLF